MAKSFTLLPWQSSLFKAFKEVYHNPNNQNLLVLARRQICHKSASALACMVYALTHSEFKTFLWFSPVYKQCKRQFLELLKWSRVYNLHAEFSFNKSELVITCTDTGSTLTFYSLSEPDNIRGETADFIVVDEACFIEDEALSLVFPMADVNKAPIMWLTTPWMKSGLFWTMWSGDDPTVTKQDWTAYDLSSITTDERIQFYKKTLSPALFKTEILGQWLDDGESILFGDITQSIENEPEYNGQLLYCGVDLAAGQNDYTSIVAMFKGADDRWHEKFTYRFNNGQVKNTLQTIAELLKPYQDQIVHIAWESNSIGAPMLQQFRDICREQGLGKIANALREDYWTVQSKTGAVANAVLLFGADKVRIHTDFLIKEVCSYTEYVNEKTGKVTYGNVHQESREYHDDACCAMLHALSAVQKRTRQPQYLIK